MKKLQIIKIKYMSKHIINREWWCFLAFGCTLYLALYNMNLCGFFEKDFPIINYNIHT